MICGRSIRRLTPEQREQAERRNQEAYERVYAEVETTMAEEYEREFGPTYRALHPYKPDGVKTHFETMRRIRESED